MESLHLAGAHAARRHALSWSPIGFAAVLLVVGACSKDSSSTDPNLATAGTAAPGAAGTTTPEAGTGVTSGTAGVGASGTGTTTAGRGAAAGGGASGSPATGTAGAGTAGRGTGTGTAGAGTTAGAGAAGTASGTGGAMTAAGSGGGSTGAGGCTREVLKGAVDAYFKALAAHDPAMMPKSDTVKATENGEMIALGTGGIWPNAGMLKYAHTALDTESCTAVSEAVVPDGSMDIPYGLRLKLQDGKITEVEAIAVRPGDYKVLGSTFPSNTRAIAASKDRVKWEEVVPADQRNTREEISGWLDKYFRTFPRGGCNFADNCQRLENGGGSFECSAALSCSMGMSSGMGGTLVPRLIVVDEELGIGVGFTIFMGNTDFHMIKMYGDQIYAVHAILGAASSSGWN